MVNDVFNQILSFLMIFIKIEKPENHTINRFLYRLIREDYSFYP